MSGPKDFVFVFMIERLEEIRRRNEAEQQARAAKVQQALMVARQANLHRRRADALGISASIDSDLATRARLAEMALAEANADAAATSPASSGPAPSPPGASLAAQNALAEERAEKKATLEGWSAALVADDVVQTFSATDVLAWQQRCDAITAAAANDFAAADFDATADTLIADAQAIHDRAGDTKARFDTRNELLRDVIASMTELGYFVSDPQFADPNDPSGPVVLKAVCGSEVVTTTVDLSSMVKSVWDGQEHEHCKGDFHQFMNAMKSRGVDVTPEREDLRERPVLKQQGAKALPRSTERQAGE